MLFLIVYREYVSITWLQFYLFFYSILISFHIYTFYTFRYFIESSKVWKNPQYNLFGNTLSLSLSLSLYSLSLSIYIYIYRYANLPQNAIVRLHHPLNGESQVPRNVFGTFFWQANLQLWQSAQTIIPPNCHKELGLWCSRIKLWAIYMQI